MSAPPGDGTAVEGGARLLVGATLSLFFLTACSIALPRSEPPPAAVEIEEAPFFPQADYQCGPAALATVLVHRGVDVAPDDLVGEVYVPERRGSLQIEMVAAARSRGLVVYRLAPDLDDLLAEVAAGNPVLVMQNLGLAVLPRWHYAVVVGHDPERGQLILRSGKVRRLATPLRTFDRTWERADRWALVVTRPDRPPATAEALPWLRAASDMEKVGQYAAAVTAYHTATRHWPDEVVAWFGLGTSGWALERGHLAETALREAVRRRPDAAEAWNNLAFVLAESGCGISARLAIACAMALRPGEEVFRNTAAAITDRPASDAGHCRPPPPCSKKAAE